MNPKCTLCCTPNDSSHPNQVRRISICRCLQIFLTKPPFHDILFEKVALHVQVDPFLENLKVAGTSDSEIPESLKPVWETHPPGRNPPRKPWVQLNWLWSGAGRFAANLKMRLNVFFTKSCPKKLLRLKCMLACINIRTVIPLRTATLFIARNRRLCTALIRNAPGPGHWMNWRYAITEREWEKFWS